MPLKTNKNWERVSYIVFPGVAMPLCILAGAYLVIHGFSNYRAAAYFKDQALSTTGMITETKIRSNLASNGMSSAPPSYISTVQFKTKQGQIANLTAYDICKAQSFTINLCIGKKVQVLYAPENPKLSMVKGESSPFDNVRNNIGWGIFMIFCGIMTFIVSPIEYAGRFGPNQHK